MMYIGLTFRGKDPPPVPPTPTYGICAFKHSLMSSIDNNFLRQSLFFKILDHNGKYF